MEFQVLPQDKSVNPDKMCIRDRGQGALLMRLSIPIMLQTGVNSIGFLILQRLIKMCIRDRFPAILNLRNGHSFFDPDRPNAPSAETAGGNAADAEPADGRGK